MNRTKERIAVVAGQTFGKYGYYKTSMEDIARAAHKAKGSLYYHFNSKELLFKTIVERELANLKSALSVIFAQEDVDVRDILKAYMLERMKILSTSINYRETLRPEFYEFYEFLNEMKDEMEQWEVEQIHVLLKKGIKHGTLEIPGKPKVYARVVVMMLKGLEGPFFLKGEYDKLLAHFDDLIHVITKGISKL